MSRCGALAVQSLLVGIGVLSAAAQTRLGPSQVAPLKGDVKGPFANTVLRDFNSAEDHGNGVSNAIAAAIQDCGSINTCLIMVPPSYGTGETVPGFKLSYAIPTDAATTPANISIVDRRYGDARMFVNNNGFSYGLLNTPAGWVYNYYAAAALNAKLSSFYLRQWSLDGGNNQQNSALSYADKTSWATVLASDVSHTPGQHESVLLSTQSTSLGNTMGINNAVTCYGGYNTQGDLGCHAMDNIVAQGNVEYSGSLTGTPFTGATALTVSATQGEYTQGSARFLVKSNSGTISGGTIANITNTYGVPPVVTGTGTSWPVSTAVGQLGTNVPAPGVVTVNPSSFTVGSLSSLRTTSLMCIADGGSFEMVYPTAVTATTLTANFTKVHPSNAIISSGGVCGYLLDLTADDVTNSTYPTKTQTIAGTLHFAFPLLTSTSASSASVWVSGDGYYQALTSRWSVTSANGYVMYPFAEVTSVQQNGGISDTLTVGPNAVTWTAGDTVSEFLYASVHHTFGNTIVESYYPNVSGANGFALNYNLPLQGNEAMITLANNGPASFYRPNGGTYSSPVGMHLTGPTTQTLLVDQPGDNATIAVGCASPCNSTATVIAAGNSAYYDFLAYDESNQRWSLSTNANNVRYYFAGNRFSVPFSNTYMTSDSSGTGYVASQQARTNTAANADFAGELAFSNATAITQPLQGRYANHPECLANAQFDPGTNNRHWITYSTTSFTVNFASSVTGSVTYSCFGRN